MEPKIPSTTLDCAGCNKELNLLVPHLSVMLKPQREVLVLTDVTEDEDNPEMVGQEITLGARSGRGVILKLHNFDCLIKWANERKGLAPVLEPHREDEVYVPEDNPDEKEIARRAREAEKKEEEA